MPARFGALEAFVAPDREVVRTKVGGRLKVDLLERTRWCIRLRYFLFTRPLSDTTACFDAIDTE